MGITRNLFLAGIMGLASLTGCHVEENADINRYDGKIDEVMGIRFIERCKSGTSNSYAVEIYNQEGEIKVHFDTSGFPNGWVNYDSKRITIRGNEFIEPPQEFDKKTKN